MPSIQAVADSTKSQVRLTLDFTDTDAAYAYVTRVDALTGASTAVRGHGASFTIGGLPYVPMQAGYSTVLYDTEAPTDSSFYYVASGPSVTLNATSQFSGGYTEPWYATSSTSTVRATSSLSGADFLSFQASGSLATPVVAAEDVPATAAVPLTLTVVASANVSQAITIGLNFRDSSGAIISTSTAAGTVLAPTTVTLSATTPANTVSAQPYIQMNGTPAATTILSVSSATLRNTAATATSGGVSLPSLGSCQLKDPLRPGLNVRVDFCFDPNPACTPTEGVFFQSLDTEQQAANSATFNVNNQVNPVVVSKVRSSVTSTLTLVSRTFADRDRLNALLASGAPLLFQVPDEYGVPDRYMSIGSTTVARTLPDHRFPIRVFSLPHAVVSAPGGPMQGTVGARWSDTCDVYATWGAVGGAGLTWTQVLQGAAG